MYTGPAGVTFTDEELSRIHECMTHSNRPEDVEIRRRIYNYLHKEMSS